MKKTGITGKIAAILFWLCIWQLIAVCIHNQILLVGPVEVLKRLRQDAWELSFWQTILTSASRIMAGFLGAFVLGSLFGILAYRYRWLKELLAPFMSTVVSVPVASFAVILLIWFGAGRLSVWISFLITFPNLYFQVLEGMNSTDKKLLEVAKVYQISGWNQAWYLYRPALAGFIRSGCRVSIGLAWKSGVAAEVIGLPEFSIGEQIYMSKIYLDTAGVLSWTITCICMSVVAEKMVLWILDRILEADIPIMGRRRTEHAGSDAVESGEVPQLRITDLRKIYGKHVIIERFTYSFEMGKTYALMDPSGSGKTTFFRMLCGLEKVDGGEIHYGERNKVQYIRQKSSIPISGDCAIVFQENRLFHNLTAEQNLALADGENRNQQLNRIVKELLPENSLNRNLGQFSGGMARRVEVLRCMLSDKKVLLLDEPFNGLDEETKKKTADFIRKYQGNRILIIATHSDEEATLLNAEKVSLKVEG